MTFRPDGAFVADCAARTVGSSKNHYFVYYITCHDGIS
jgi:hypothetical protein